jgi:thioredoxin reductase (NADPH)
LLRDSPRKSCPDRTGADYGRLDAENRERFEGVGVYYAATALEGQICRNETVIVAGAATRPDKRRCFFPMARPKCCSSFGRRHYQKNVGLSLAVACRRSETSRFFIEQRSQKCPAEKKLEQSRTGKYQDRRAQGCANAGRVFNGRRSPCTDWLPAEIERDDKGFVKTGTAVA